MALVKLDEYAKTKAAQSFRLGGFPIYQCFGSGSLPPACCLNVIRRERLVALIALWLSVRTDGLNLQTTPLIEKQRKQMLYAKQRTQTYMGAKYISKGN